MISKIRYIAALFLFCVGFTQIAPALVDAARKEGRVVSYASGADWGGYGFVSQVISGRYGLDHNDISLTAAESLAKLEAEKNNPVADVTDLNLQFSEIAIDRGLLLPYKNSKWDEIPAWAKDANGQYAAAYLATVAFVSNPRVVRNPPRTWQDLLKPEYRGLISMNDPRNSGQAQSAVLAVTLANGGSPTNLDPGIKYFAQLQKSGNLKPVSPNQDLLSRGEIGIAITFDLRATQWKKAVPQLVLQVPQDGSIYVPYAPVINKFTRRPNAAKLWVETVFSDEGQIAFARAGARPIRKVKLPKDVEEGLIPDEQYQVVRTLTSWKNLDAVVKVIGDRWATEVLGQ